MENNLKVLKNDKGYMLWGGKAHECKYLFTKFKIYMKNGEEKWSAQHIVEISGGVTVNANTQDLYDTLEAYEKGICAETVEKSFVTDIMPCITQKYDCSYDGRKITFYTFVDCEAIENVKSLDCVRFTYKDRKWTDDNSVFPHTATVYMSREDAIGFNGYKVVKADGTEEIREGLLKRLMLEPDQQKLIDELKDLMKRIHDADIFFATDCEETSYALNMRKIDHITMDYDNPHYNSATVEWKECYCTRKPFDIGHLFDIYSSDNEFWIGKNKEQA